MADLTAARTFRAQLQNVDVHLYSLEFSFAFALGGRPAPELHGRAVALALAFAEVASLLLLVPDGVTHGLVRIKGEVHLLLVIDLVEVFFENEHKIAIVPLVVVVDGCSNEVAGVILVVLSKTVVVRARRADVSCMIN